MDAHANFAYSLVDTAPSPALSGTSLVVTSGQGALFPAAPFNAVVYPSGAQPLSTNAEIVRVTNVTGDTLTITREQESTSARSILVGDQISASITKKTLTDIEAGPAVSAGTTSANLSSMVFSDANDIRFGLSGSTITAKRGVYSLDNFDQFGNANVIPNSLPNTFGTQTIWASTLAAATGTAIMLPFILTDDVTFSMVRASVSIAFTGVGGPFHSGQTFGQTVKNSFGLYSLNGTTLSQIASNSYSLVFNNSNSGTNSGTGNTTNTASISFVFPGSANSAGYTYSTASITASGAASGSRSTAVSASFDSYADIREIPLVFGQTLSLPKGTYYLGHMLQNSTTGGTATTNAGTSQPMRISSIGFMGRSHSAMATGTLGFSLPMPAMPFGSHTSANTNWLPGFTGNGAATGQYFGSNSVGSAALAATYPITNFRWFSSVSDTNGTTNTLISVLPALSFV